MSGRDSSVGGITNAKFVFHNKLLLKDMPLFENVCKYFHFTKRDSVLFVKKTEIFEMDFMDGKIKTIHKFMDSFVH